MTKKLTKGKKQKQHEFANRGKDRDRNIKLHMLRRFQERHDAIIGVLDIEKMLEQIKNKTAILISWDKGRKSYRVLFRGKHIVIVTEGKGEKRVIVTTYIFEVRHKEMIDKRLKNEELQTG